MKHLLIIAALFMGCGETENKPLIKDTITHATEEEVVIDSYIAGYMEGANSAIQAKSTKEFYLQRTVDSLKYAKMINGIYQRFK